MTPLLIGFFALLAGLLVGTIAVWGAPVFAIPIVLVALLALGGGQMRRRVRDAQSVEEMRRQAKAEKVEFTERDRQTTV